MKPITINELAPLLDTPRFTGGFFATKGARLGVAAAAIGLILSSGLFGEAWGVGFAAGITMPLVCLIVIPATIRKRYAAELIAEGLPERIGYLYRKYKAGNRMARWIDQWYEDFNSGSAMKPSQMLVILQHTWISAYSGLSEKRGALKNKNQRKTQAFTKSMNNGKPVY